jgi:hypothetical protein
MFRVVSIVIVVYFEESALEEWTMNACLSLSHAFFSASVWLNMTPITRGTIVRLRWDKTDISTVGLFCEEQNKS